MMNGVNDTNSTILDSRLILATNLTKPITDKSVYNIKIVSCGDYLQVYKFNDEKIKKNKNDDNYKINKNKSILDVDTDRLKKIDSDLKEIDNKNINRSKLSCQRLAKANSKEWKSFITLTFDVKKFLVNLKEVSVTNKMFKNFVDKVRRVYKNFKYIAVPEFHKSGVVHYHLLTNLGIEHTNLIYRQEDNKKFLHIKYWNYGFTSVEIVQGDMKKIIGYISKYMTKDVDNRLFSKHRYLYSKNLLKPSISYLDLSNNKHLEFYKKILGQKKLIYNNTYQNFYNGDLVCFDEYL